MKCIIIYETTTFPQYPSPSGGVTGQLRCTTHNCSFILTGEYCIIGLIEEIKERLDRIEEKLK